MVKGLGRYSWSRFMTYTRVMCMVSSTCGPMKVVSGIITIKILIITPCRVNYNECHFLFLLKIESGNESPDRVVLLSTIVPCEIRWHFIWSVWSFSWKYFKSLYNSEIVYYISSVLSIIIRPKWFGTNYTGIFIKSSNVAGMYYRCSMYNIKRVVLLIKSNYRRKIIRYYFVHCIERLFFINDTVFLYVCINMFISIIVYTYFQKRNSMF